MNGRNEAHNGNNGVNENKVLSNDREYEYADNREHSTQWKEKRPAYPLRQLLIFRNHDIRPPNGTVCGAHAVGADGTVSWHIRSHSRPAPAVPNVRRLTDAVTEAG